MQRQTHTAIWLRMLAEKEIGAARGAKSLLKANGIKISNAYLEGGEFAVTQVVDYSQNEWIRFLVSTYTHVSKVFAQYAKDQIVGEKSKSDTFTDAMQRWISSQAYLKSRYITETTHEIVKTVISNGVADGLGEAEIAKDLKKYFVGGVGTSRARMIARTEVHNAASFGMQNGAEQTQLPLVREWVAVNDERTREDHADADGQRRSMDDPFDIGGENLDYPGDGSAEQSINCRCTLIYTQADTNSVGVSESGDF